MIPLSQLWYRFCRCVLWATVKLLFRFRSFGSEHVPPTGPVLVVSNHQSHLDPVLAGVASPRQLRALARRSLFVGPFGWLIRSLGAFPIDLEGSGIAGLRASLKILKGGEALLVFPEGTRTADGSLGPLRSGFCALARRSGATIVPAAINGSFAALPRGARFPQMRPITLRFAPPITPNDFEQLTDDQLVELTTTRIAACLQ